MNTLQNISISYTESLPSLLYISTNCTCKKILLQRILYNNQCLKASLLRITYIHELIISVLFNN